MSFETSLARLPPPLWAAFEIQAEFAKIALLFLLTCRIASHFFVAVLELMQGRFICVLIFGTGTWYRFPCDVLKISSYIFQGSKKYRISMSYKF